MFHFLNVETLVLIANAFSSATRCAVLPQLTSCYQAAFTKSMPLSHGGFTLLLLFSSSWVLLFIMLASALFVVNFRQLNIWKR